MARIPLITADSELSEAQRRVVDAILGKRGGRIPAPYRLSLHCPDLTEVWHPLGETLRLKSGFPLRLSELAILIAARSWDCDFVFIAHAVHALKGGIAQSVIDSMARGERPKFEHSDEEALYDFGTELFEHNAISDATYARALALFGTPGVVELTALIGYYGMVCMTLIAHDMPLADGTRPLLFKKNKSV
jgi:4-carboxymuconolactone decarboxylase